MVYGDGEQSRDFTFIDNVVEANLLAASTPGIGGQIYNIASNGSHTLLELIGLIAKELGKRIEPRFDPPRAGDIKHSWADISKAEREMGYRVKVGFEEGISKTCEWLKYGI